MIPKDEFNKYAVKHAGISSMNMHRYTSMTNAQFTSSVTPRIIEERQLTWQKWTFFRV